MSVILIIFLAIFAIIISFSLYFFIADFVIYYRLLKQYYSSYMNVNIFGYLIAISGKIRAGKTIFMHAITHCLTMHINNKIKAKMYDIETKLIEINFVKVKELFNKYLEENLDLENIIELTIKSFEVHMDDGITYSYKLGELYFDGLKYILKLDMLKEYIELYYHSIRTDRVFSNIKSWNQITKTYSKNLKQDWLRIKDQYEKKSICFPFDKYSILNIDEQLLENSNVNSGQKKDEDNGSDVVYRLFGQVFKETSYCATTLQDVARWFKGEREIYQTFPYIHSNRIIYNKPLYFRYLNILEAINNWFYSKHNDPDFVAKENKYKRRNLKILKKKEKIIANSFIEFNVSMYQDYERVGKTIKADDVTSSEYNTTLIYPVCYCWDIGDTHAFYILFEYLKKNSKLDRENLYASSLNFDDIEKMLIKFKDKKEDKSSNLNKVQEFNPEFFK